MSFDNRTMPSQIIMSVLYRSISWKDLLIGLLLKKINVKKEIVYLLTFIYIYSSCTFVEKNPYYIV